MSKVPSRKNFASNPLDEGVATEINLMKGNEKLITKGLKTSTEMQKPRAQSIIQLKSSNKIGRLSINEDSARLIKEKETGMTFFRVRSKDNINRATKVGTDL